ncbi:protein HYPER-SENSITIVITY-RELATED 4-like [Macadamia integrifolia]|uniref:protein HYPER-SENSITIVITY-RELATED 4-like n=1 Tax=Macadamia integrifolia TaxID=60698 RepID=UPI001C4F205E|nr:protein HYPER-SENSITIVITY-RELATED 4-like [Macadamia integrifolia]
MTMSSTNMPSVQTILSTAASVAASVMLVRTILQDFLPEQVQDYVSSGLRRLINSFSSELTIVIDEFDKLTNNQVYEAAEIYLGNRISPNTQTLRISKSEKEKSLKVAMVKYEEMVDTFDGIQFKWSLVCTKIESNKVSSSVFIRNTEKVLQSYLTHILEQSKSTKGENKTLKLFTVNESGLYDNFADAWVSINLDHAATFDTLAMDVELKRMVMEDLERFVQRKEFHRRVGKAWKRGYLLYGPPVTLSGLLNFTDGLWSSCGDERIIVFTTNHKDRLDPALLRLGGIDMHIHMSFCTPSGFKILASNYLQINDHPLFTEIEELIEKVKVTPAMVAEELMKKGNLEVALKGLLEFLHSKEKESEEAKISETQKEDPDKKKRVDYSI